MGNSEKVIKEYEDYVNSYISLTTSHDYEFEMHKAVLALLKGQEEREKRICKAICDLIRGSCSTDTYADKEFVCHEIQECFMKGG